MVRVRRDAVQHRHRFRDVSVEESEFGKTEPCLVTLVWCCRRGGSDNRKCLHCGEGIGPADVDLTETELDVSAKERRDRRRCHDLLKSLQCQVQIEILAEVDRGVLVQGLRRIFGVGIFVHDLIERRKGAGESRTRF
jgi:hypothetical protein